MPEDKDYRARPDKPNNNSESAGAHRNLTSVCDHRHYPSHKRAGSRDNVTIKSHARSGQEPIENIFEIRDTMTPWDASWNLAHIRFHGGPIQPDISETAL